MIVVVADDLSGAAELANVAVSAGFTAELQMDFAADAGVDVVCVDTDTRLLGENAAAARFAEIGKQVAAAAPGFIFKKCDSVLRGHTAAESRALAAALGKSRILLVPANPSRGRIIRGGEYFVNDVPLAQTAFASDPEHPRWTSNIAKLLGGAADIESPDAASADDLARLAATVNDVTLAVGAADFFGALLASRGFITRTPASALEPAAAGARLFVCGSSASWISGRKEQCGRANVPVFPMPQALFAPELRDEILCCWADFCATALADRGSAMLAIGGDEPLPGVTAAMLTARLAEAVELALDRTECARVHLEGGATAAAVLRQLGHRRFHVLPSPGAGVGAFSPVGASAPIFLAKPGSYDWPEAVWTA